MATNRESVDIWYSVKNGMIEKPPVDGWHFYYDETNNFRKFRFDPKKPSGYNVDRALKYDFILGGIAFAPGKEPETDSLMERLGIQKDNELKAGSILKNHDFLKDISLKRTHIFLEWLLESGAIVHYSALNNLYWALIDLVDEALQTDAGAVAMLFHKNMKDQLFFFMMNHLDEMTSILSNYGFPNIDNDSINPFARAVSDFILENSHDNTPELFYLELARQIIKGLRNEKEMEFLSGGESGVMIDSYVGEYIHEMQGKPNAIHHFDYEKTVVKNLEKYRLLDGPEEFLGYEFIDSKKNRLVQVCDVFIGLLSEYFHFTDTIVLKKKYLIPGLSEEQREGIHLLRDVTATSEKVSFYFQKHICPEEFMNMRYRFLEME